MYTEKLARRRAEKQAYYNVMYEDILNRYFPEAVASEDIISDTTIMKILRYYVGICLDTMGLSVIGRHRTDFIKVIEEFGEYLDLSFEQKYLLRTVNKYDAVDYILLLEGKWKENPYRRKIKWAEEQE